MRNTTHLRDMEVRIGYLVTVMTEAERDEMAKLGLLLHVIYNDTMTTTARHKFNDLLRGIGPDFLLVFRALRQVARGIVIKRKNWRSRT